MKRAISTVVVASVAGLSGCAAPRDAGFSEVSELAGDRTGFAVEWTRDTEDDARVAAVVEGLLRDELTVDQAVQVALLSNRRLQATYEQLGIARGELIGAAIPTNPVASDDIRFFDAGTEHEVTVVQDVISILTIPLRRKRERNQFEATVERVSDRVLHVVAETRRAYVGYQAAKQLVDLFGQTVTATESSYMTAARLREAGNVKQLDVLRERAFYEEAKVDLNAAQRELAIARERLNGVMGVWGLQTTWDTPARLPEVPAAAVESANAAAADRFAAVETLAIERNLHLSAQRHLIEAQAAEMDREIITALFPFLNLGVVPTFTAEGEFAIGPTFDIPVPIFDFGQAAYPREASRLRSLLEDYAATAVELRAAARALEAQLQANRANAAYRRDVVMPLRAAVVAEAQLNYNAMTLTPFELIVAKRQQIDAAVAYVHAVRDYWMARTDLEQLLDGGMPPMVGSMGVMK